MRRVAFFGVLALAACVDHRGPITGTQALKVELTSPADPGSVTNRLPDTAKTVSLKVTAYDAENKVDTSYNAKLQVYAQYLGTLTPYLGATPLATIQMAGGIGTLATLTLPSAFGPTTVWVDDGDDADATYASGVSPTLWYRDPLISDIQTPVNEMAIDALQDGPLDNKNVTVNQSRWGARGRLVVTSVFSQGYTLADVQCADANGTPPCLTSNTGATGFTGPNGYDYIEVFSYSAPLDQDKRFLDEGQVIDGFAGGVTEFDGLTEIGFPQSFVAGAAVVDVAREPPPVKLDVSWFTTAKIQFEKNEGGAIEIDNATVCPLDSDYITFKQWKLDISGGSACSGNGSNLINVISTGVVNLDPATLKGMVLPKLVGMLRPINIGSFNVWLVYPRGMSDLTLP